MSVLARLRRAVAGLEDLTAGRFILLVGAIGGVLRSYPASCVEHATVRLVFVLFVLTDAAAVLLWWVAVRRRRFSVWKTALHVMLGLDLADALGFGLILAMLSLDARRHMVNAVVHKPVMDLVGVFAAPILIRFVVAAAAVAFGRVLPGRGKPVAAPG